MSQANTNVTPLKAANQRLKANLFGAGQMMMRWMSAMRAGMAFGGKRDMYNVFGYPLNPTVNDLLQKYERQDIAQRIVDKPAEGIWTDPPEILVEEGQGNTGFNNTWSELAERLDLWTTLFQVDRLCAFKEFSAVLLGLPGESESPAQARGPDDLVYVRAYGLDAIMIDSYNKDYNSPRFGMPEFYRLSTVGDRNFLAGNSLRVHHSRIVHVVDKPLMGSTTSVPRLQVLYNVLDDVLKTAGGSAEAFWLTANRGLQADIDPEMELDEGDANDLADELEEYQHQLRRVIRTRGVKITSLGSDVADPTGVFRVSIALISAATGIPQRILIGAEAGQLASEQDRANWATFIDARRRYFAQPWVLRPLIHQLQTIGVLRKISGKLAVLTYKWPEAFKMSPLERGQTSAQWARAVINMSKRNEKGDPIVSDEECREALGLQRDPIAGDTFPEMPEPVNPATPGGGDTGDGEDEPDETRPNRPNRPGQDGPAGG
jgi:hypothetical protein